MLKLMIRYSGGWKFNAQLIDVCEFLDLMKCDKAGQDSCLSSFSGADWLLFRGKAWNGIPVHTPHGMHTGTVFCMLTKKG